MPKNSALKICLFLMLLVIGCTPRCSSSNSSKTQMGASTVPESRSFSIVAWRIDAFPSAICPEDFSKAAESSLTSLEEKSPVLTVHEFFPKDFLRLELTNPGQYEFSLKHYRSPDATGLGSPSKQVQTMVGESWQILEIPVTEPEGAQTVWNVAVRADPGSGSSRIAQSRCAEKFLRSNTVESWMLPRNQVLSRLPPNFMVDLQFSLIKADYSCDEDWYRWPSNCRGREELFRTRDLGIFENDELGVSDLSPGEYSVKAIVSSRDSRGKMKKTPYTAFLQSVQIGYESKKIKLNLWPTSNWSSTLELTVQAREMVLPDGDLCSGFGGCSTDYICSSLDPWFSCRVQASTDKGLRVFEMVNCDKAVMYRTLQHDLEQAKIKMKMSEYDKLFNCQPAQPTKL